MAGNTFYIKQYDTLSPLEDTLLDPDGNAIDLTGVSEVRLHTASGSPKSPTYVLDEAATIVNPPGADGKVRYSFVSPQTDTAATFLREWLIVWGPGQYQRVPTDWDDKLVIFPAAGPNPT